MALDDGRADILGLLLGEAVESEVIENEQVRGQVAAEGDFKAVSARAWPSSRSRKSARRKRTGWAARVAAAPSASGALTDVGIDDSFIKRVRSEVTPGTSAPLSADHRRVTDKVADRMKREQFEIIASSLPIEEEKKLRDVFAA